MPNRGEFYPVVSRLISMLSRVTKQKDDTKFQSEFAGFIELISTRRGIRWSRVISDSLVQQLRHIQRTKKFYMNSYLVFLLLHGKERVTSIANTQYLYDPTHPVWENYPQFYAHNKWNSGNWMTITNGFEGKIYEEILGRANVFRISNEAAATIKGHADFFMEDIEFTYLKVYGSKEAPYKLPRYASDRLILMEFSRHLLNIHDKVWVKKASATYQLPVIIGNYECTT